MDVAVLGWGAIGRTVGTGLVDGRVPGARLRAVAVRRHGPGQEAEIGCPVPLVDASELADGSDVVVEAAGHAALAAHGETYLRAGCRLLVVSVGALVDAELLARLEEAGADRLYLTTGAIGGLDLLRAARRAGRLDQVILTTTKPATTLGVDPAGPEPVTLFDGPAAEAVRRFPESVNVAATLALTAGSWDLVRVRVVADPGVERNRHDIAIDGEAGRYRFSIENRPSPDNPRTSGIVPHAVLQGLASLAGGGWRLAVG